MILPYFAVNGQMVDHAANRQVRNALSAEEHICRAAVHIDDDRVPDTGIRHIKGNRKCRK